MSKVRVVEDKDIPRVIEIYRPSVLENATSFELTLPPLVEMTQRIHTTLKSYPWLVFEEDGVIKGYAYAGAHRSRIAYQWCVESSVYVDKAFARQSVGQKLYQELFQILKQLRIVNVYAGITLPNDASVSFHKSFGFVEIGTYKKVGYKMEQWRDVIWYSLRLSEEIHGQPPTSFSSFNNP